MPIGNLKWNKKEISCLVIAEGNEQQKMDYLLFSRGLQWE
jgi:hypothetical protein